MKPIAWRKLIRRLRLFGFQGPHPGGRHPFMTKGDLSITIPNPHHGDISVGLLKEILKQAGNRFVHRGGMFAVLLKIGVLIPCRVVGVVGVVHLNVAHA